MVALTAPSTLTLTAGGAGTVGTTTGVGVGCGGRGLPALAVPTLKPTEASAKTVNANKRLREITCDENVMLHYLLRLM